jgi:hypothetical protein
MYGRPVLSCIYADKLGEIALSRPTKAFLSRPALQLNLVLMVLRKVTIT